VEERSHWVEELQSLFESCQPLVKDYASTELRPSDMFVVLAAHILWRLWTETREDKYFWKAVVQLESARKVSASNADVMMLLVKFYNQIGEIFQFRLLASSFLLARGCFETAKNRGLFYTQSQFPPLRPL
jgi:hypothetical protein